ncbi:MAG: glycoside hydrolase family 88 protein [Clostridia bacterium]|nr:glycoside hydrolase family 88 protein [Clostridia bacterium]
MQAQSFQKDWSVKMADSAMSCPSKYMEKWCYEFGLILKAIETVWSKTGDDKYYRYIKENVDRFVDSEGKIDEYDPGELNLDHVNPGKVLLLLYNETHDERYKKAADILRDQLNRQPRNLQGGFWHKRIYPHQMWLDGVYMSSPFYAQYALMFDETIAFDDIANQVILLADNAKDPNTGLLYHAWDESKGMKWADDCTGCSPNFWGRAMGWYAMALVDILDYFPAEHVQREKIINILRNLINALISVQDKATGVWYQVVDKGTKKGNYLEASASCMFTYALAKSIRMGYIDSSYKNVAIKAFKGILKEFVETDEKGMVDLKNVCSVAGLGGNPYRDGSFEYYISEPVAVNDYKGYGPLILASVEIERLEGCCHE